MSSSKCPTYYDCRILANARSIEMPDTVTILVTYEGWRIRYKKTINYGWSVKAEVYFEEGLNFENVVNCDYNMHPSIQCIEFWNFVQEIVRKEQGRRKDQQLEKTLKVLDKMISETQNPGVF